MAVIQNTSTLETPLTHSVNNNTVASSIETHALATPIINQETNNFREEITTELITPIIEQEASTLRQALVSSSFATPMLLPSVNGTYADPYDPNSIRFINNKCVYTCTGLCCAFDSALALYQTQLLLSPVNINGTLATTVEQALHMINTARTQVNVDWNASSGVTAICNKPVLASVATLGTYNSLIDKPDFADVAYSGCYCDLCDLPTIPAAQVNSDWLATSGVAVICNKPVLSCVACSGNYDDLLNKPDLCSIQQQSDWNQANSSYPTYIKNKPELARVATSGLYADLLGAPAIPEQVNADWLALSGPAYICNKPSLSEVAISGDYNDLRNIPPDTSKTYTFSFDESTHKLAVTEHGLFGDTVIFNDTIDTAYSFEYEDSTLTITDNRNNTYIVNIGTDFYTKDEVNDLISAITDLIPEQASVTNQLADKDFVNSSIATNTANFCGTFTNLACLCATVATPNDYAFYAHCDTCGNCVYDRYKYNANCTWVCEYTLNNSSFTANQWAAINSGITSTAVAKITDVYNCTIQLCNANGTVLLGSFTLNQNQNTCICLDVGGGTVTGIKVYCGTNCKCTIDNNTALCLSSNAFNTYAQISTTTYPGACCTGDVSASSLAAVATSGNYNDLTGKPTIPTVNNKTITICHGTTCDGSFTLNQATDCAIKLPAYPPDLSNCAGLTCTGTVTSVNVSVNGTSGTAITSSGTITLTNVKGCVNIGSASLVDIDRFLILPSYTDSTTIEQNGNFATDTGLSYNPSKLALNIGRAGNNSAGVICAQGSCSRNMMICFLNNTGDAYGNGYSIGGGGIGILGAGESASTTWAALNNNSTNLYGGAAGTETLFLTSDNEICLITNLNNYWADGKTVRIYNGDVYACNSVSRASVYSSNTYNSGYFLLAQINSTGTANHDAGMAGTVYIDRVGSTICLPFRLYVRGNNATVGTVSFTGPYATNGDIVATYTVSGCTYTLRLYYKITGNYQRAYTVIDYTTLGDVSTPVSNHCVSFPGTYSADVTGTNISYVYCVVGGATCAICAICACCAGYVDRTAVNDANNYSLLLGYANTTAAGTGVYTSKTNTITYQPSTGILCMHNTMINACAGNFSEGLRINRSAPASGDSWTSLVIGGCNGTCIGATEVFWIGRHHTAADNNKLFISYGMSLTSCGYFYTPLNNGTPVNGGACWCGNVSGTASCATNATYAQLVYLDSFTASADIPVMVACPRGTTGYSDQGVSTACPLTFNPATGVLKTCCVCSADGKLTTCTGTVTGINVYCGTTCKCKLTDTCSLQLGTMAWCNNTSGIATYTTIDFSNMCTGAHCMLVCIRIGPTVPVESSCRECWYYWVCPAGIYASYIHTSDRTTDFYVTTDSTWCQRYCNTGYWHGNNNWCSGNSEYRSCTDSWTSAYYISYMLYQALGKTIVYSMWFPALGTDGYGCCTMLQLYMVGACCSNDITPSVLWKYYGTDRINYIDNTSVICWTQDFNYGAAYRFSCYSCYPPFSQHGMCKCTNGDNQALLYINKCARFKFTVVHAPI